MSPATKKSAAEARGTARRQALLDAARQVFSQKGYHPATVDDITRVAGVAKGTFYLYFSEKRAVFYDLMQQFFEMVTNVGMSVSRDVGTKKEYFARTEAAASHLVELFQNNAAWRDLFQFNEYFNGCNGAGVGASHQTGWTAVVAKMITQLQRWR